jgi:hypothetical protein
LDGAVKAGGVLCLPLAGIRKAVAGKPKSIRIEWTVGSPRGLARFDAGADAVGFRRYLYDALSSAHSCYDWPWVDQTTQSQDAQIARVGFQMEPFVPAPGDYVLVSGFGTLHRMYLNYCLREDPSRFRAAADEWLLGMGRMCEKPAATDTCICQIGESPYGVSLSLYRLYEDDFCLFVRPKPQSGPISPPAVSIPFAELPEEPLIKGNRYKVKFDRITT